MQGREMPLNPGVRVRRVWCVLPMLVAIAAIVACGGYGGSGNTYTPGTVSMPARLAVGTITGFGSVRLNGLEFETTSATIMVNGKAAQQSDLHAGQMIEVKGHHDTGSDQDVADEIEFRANVAGPVSAIDAVAQTLVVLGQTVSVSADTSFADNISPANLASISVGDILEVSGMQATDGTVHATRIERKPAGTQLQVIGTASATDATAKTLGINALVVDFSTATLIGFPSAGPKDGDLVEASGAALNSAGALVATELELRTGKELKADTDSKSEVEGLITRFASPADFDVAGRPVATSSTTMFDGGAASDLALNLRVEVEGTVDANGVLDAAKVHIAQPAEDRLVGQVESVAAGSATLVVLGIQITVDGMTRLEDHGPTKLETFSLADVRSGDWLEIRGGVSGAGSASLTATRVDRLQPQANVSLTGAVASVAQPNFTILTTTIATTPATQFANGLNATTFFASTAGKIVSVRGSWDGATLTAQSVQVGDEED